MELRQSPLRAQLRGQHKHTKKWLHEAEREVDFDVVPCPTFQGHMTCLSPVLWGKNFGKNFEKIFWSFEISNLNFEFWTLNFEFEFWILNLNFQVWKMNFEVWNWNLNQNSTHAFPMGDFRFKFQFQNLKLQIQKSNFKFKFQNSNSNFQNSNSNFKFKFSKFKFKLKIHFGNFICVCALSWLILGIKSLLNTCRGAWILSPLWKSRDPHNPPLAYGHRWVMRVTWLSSWR